MELPANKRILGRTAACLGVVQGLAWAAMSLAAIILYKWSPTFDDATTYTREIGLLLYQVFIQDTSSNTNFVVRPLDFTIFMWIYFIMSVGWVALSLDQFVAIHYNKGRQKPIILMWSILTLIVSLIDLIFTCLLARDYSTCNEYSVDTYNYSCYLAFGIAMTLAARGYTLWLVNVILSFYMLRTAVNIERRKDKFANLFSDHSIPRVTIPKANNTVPIHRSEELEPNYLNHDNSFPSFLYPTDKLEQEDTLRSFQSRSDRSNENRAPSFLSRGEKFSY